MDYLAPEISNLDLASYMQEALQEADLAGQAGERPFGAVLVIDGKVIARGRASHRASKNQVRHAELNAILSGGEPLWHGFRRTILVTTVEPCPLCLGAAVMADIPHIIFGMHDTIVHSTDTLKANPYMRKHIKSYHGGVLAEQSAALFAKYDPQMLKYMQTGVFDHSAE